LLVLAASTYQIPAIETAKRSGYRVITTDNVPANPGHVLADASFGVDTMDTEAVLALAKREGIAGVIAPGTDVAVLTASYLANQLDLPGPTPEAACILTHKHLFREFLRQAGLPCPRALLVSTNELPRARLFDGRNWLVKPCRSSGSKGIFIVRTAAEFLSRVAESRTFSMDGTAVLEEFIDGTQHTCEGVLQEGRVALALLTDRDTAPPPHTATTGHRVPTRLAEPVQKKALNLIEGVFSRLRVTNGPFDCDFVVQGTRIVLIEMTPRLGGNSLSKLFRTALDFDLVAYAVACACGDPYPLPTVRDPKPSSIAILGVDRPGRLTWNESEAESLRGEAWVHNLIFDMPPGARVEPFINGRHRVGEVLVAGASREDVDGRLVEIKQRLSLTAV
jgi:biotin carboxylase